MYAHNCGIEGITIKKQTLCFAVQRQVCVCVSWVSEVNDEDHSGCDWPDGSADSAGLWMAFRSKVTSLQTSATIRPSDQSGPAQEILLTGYGPSLVLISAWSDLWGQLCCNYHLIWSHFELFWIIVHDLEPQEEKAVKCLDSHTGFIWASPLTSSVAGGLPAGAGCRFCLLTSSQAGRGWWVGLWIAPRFPSHAPVKNWISLCRQDAGAMWCDKVRSAVAARRWGQEHQT